MCVVNSSWNIFKFCPAKDQYAVSVHKHIIRSISIFYIYLQSPCVLSTSRENTCTAVLFIIASTIANFSLYLSLVSSFLPFFRRTRSHGHNTTTHQTIWLLFIKLFTCVTLDMRTATAEATEKRAKAHTHMHCNRLDVTRLFWQVF